MPPDLITDSPPSFTTRLLTWYDQHGRKNLPWQHAASDASPTQRAYGVWVSEIMLQQTQVATVIPYYQRFMQRFPDIPTLATAALDDVLHHWSGLGYYARARNLHKAAQHIVEHHQGEFPQDFDAALALPGIGKSTAGAILAFSFDQRHPILDGNVKRVLTRYHGIDGYPGKREIETRLWAVADQHTPHQRVAAYTQAIMDLGATVCTRNKPACPRCPHVENCVAHQQNRTAELPTKKPKPQKARRHDACYMLVVIDHQQQLGLEKRPTSGIWGGLFCFPQFETLGAVTIWLKQRSLDEDALESPEHIIEHRFTHFDLSIQPLYLRLTRRDSKPDFAVWYNPQQPDKLGLPTPIQHIIDTL